MQTANVNKKKRKRNAAIKSELLLQSLSKNPEFERIEHGGSIGYIHQYQFSLHCKQQRHTKTFDISQFPTLEDAENAAKKYGETYLAENKIKNAKGGCVWEREYYLFKLKEPRESKCFNVKDYINKQAALDAAIEYQKKRSAELNLDHKIPALNVSVDMKQMIAGFLDGDGVISVDRHKLGVYIVRVRFTQSEDDGTPKVLEVIQQIYGGRMTSKPPQGNKRRMWTLEIAKESLYVILNHLAENSVLKRRQVEIALKCYRDLLADRAEKCEEYRMAVRRLKDEYQLQLAKRFFELQQAKNPATKEERKEIEATLRKLKKK